MFFVNDFINCDASELYCVSITESALRPKHVLSLSNPLFAINDSILMRY
jgi:hypothetical protein